MAVRRHDIRVHAQTQYLPEHSDPGSGRYVFAYEITVENHGAHAARLLRRHWLITDASGEVTEVEGEGVVGEQPHINPGEGFSYTSSATLATPVGQMEGEYHMVCDDGEHFDAEIPAFTLAVPRALH